MKTPLANIEFDPRHPYRDDSPSVVALGNFDGVHLGHAALIEAARGLSQEIGAPLGVVTFEPHPRSVLNPGAPPFRLTTAGQKARHLAALGVRHLFPLHFDAGFAALPAARFEAEILGERLNVRGIVAGQDFHYGFERGGSFASLLAFGQRRGIPVLQAPVARDARGEPYSSTRVRQALIDARPDHAAALLGRPWEVEFTVEHGDRRGRELGFPTANGRFGELLVPAHGIYAIRAAIEGREGMLDGVASIGIRPMWQTPEPLIEAHLFDFNEEIYDRTLRVLLIGYLRPEMHFPGIAELVKQIEIDCAEARSYLFNS